MPEDELAGPREDVSRSLGIGGEMTLKDAMDRLKVGSAGKTGPAALTPDKASRVVGLGVSSTGFKIYA